MTSSLYQAIEGVYCAFGDVPQPPLVEGCHRCFCMKESCMLLSRPLREVSPDQLSHYAASVFRTVGGVGDFLYFLPRILEVLASVPDWWPVPEVVTRAMHTAGFHAWPDYRREALARYFDEVIDDLLATENSGRLLDSWICALGRLHVDLEPLLARVAANRKRLVELYEVNSEPLVSSRLANGFWRAAPRERNKVLDWFRSSETRRTLERWYGLNHLLIN